LWQADEHKLAATILADAPANGFSIESATLSPYEWKLLHEELLSRSKTE
jgi:hypothetical protein